LPRQCLDLNPSIEGFMLCEINYGGIKNKSVH